MHILTIQMYKLCSANSPHIDQLDIRDFGNQVSHLYEKIDAESFLKCQLDPYAVTIEKMMENILNQWRALYNNLNGLSLHTVLIRRPNIISPLILTPYIKVDQNHDFNENDLLLRNYTSIVFIN